jgi:hypothetical protein
MDTKTTITCGECGWPVALDGGCMCPRDPIARREAHIIDLARIIAAQAPPVASSSAKTARISGNNCKSSAYFTCSEHGKYDEGDAQWNVTLDDEWAGACRYCLPAAIESGEVVLDRRSAHETLAYMLGGRAGRDEYTAYFVAEAEAEARIRATATEGIPSFLLGA